jgi:thioredoxin reductase (NADPH)
MMTATEQAIVVGSGPAGYTAALYLARADLRPLVVEGIAWGGLLQETTDVENYPGFPQGVLGPDLMQGLRDQAERFGARFVTELATSIDLSHAADATHRVWVGDDSYAAPAVILAMGAEHKKLGVPGEAELGGLGVSYCATCDAAFFRNRDACVIGGGDSAMEEAIFLAKFASKVTIINRRQDFRASPIMLDRARSLANIEWMTPYVVSEFVTGPTGPLGGLRLQHVADGTLADLPVAGAFVAIGHEPQSELVDGQLPLNEAGYVLVEGRSTRTGIAGVFAAGDLVDHTYRQAITAAGSGCQAALDAQWYLRDSTAFHLSEASSAA